MATRRARVKMVPNFTAGRGRSRPGPGRMSGMGGDKTDSNDDKKVTSETVKPTEEKMNVVDNIVDFFDLNADGGQQVKAVDEKLQKKGTTTRSRSRSSEKDKPKENIEPSKTLAVVPKSETTTNRSDDQKVNVSKPPTEINVTKPPTEIISNLNGPNLHVSKPPTEINVTKPPTEIISNLNGPNLQEDPLMNPLTDLKINPLKINPLIECPVKLTNDAEIKETSAKIIPPKVTQNDLPEDVDINTTKETRTEPLQVNPTTPPNNAVLKQHDVPIPPAPATVTRTSLPTRFKQKFKPNLGTTDIRVRRARKLSGGDRRPPTLSGSECSPGRARTTSIGSACGMEEEAVTVVPPPAVDRPVVDINGMPDTPLLSGNRRRSEEHNLRVGQEEVLPPKMEGRTRKVTGSKQPDKSGKQPDKSGNQLMRRKQDHKRKFQSGVPERRRMTMFDLIYYNPEHGQRMSTDEPEANADDIIEERETVVDNVPDEVADIPEQADQDMNGSPGDEDNAMPVPQVKVGPNGEIILDEASTIVETTQAKKAKEDLQNSPLVFENANRATNYGTWSKKRKHSDWSNKETLKFYRALSVVGSDFSMMASLFSTKTRQELKLKFKKEEKINGALIDRCLKQQGQYTDLQEFDEESEEDDDPPIVQKRARQKSKPRKLRAGTRRITKNRGYYSSSDPDEDDSSLRSPPKASSHFRHKPPAGITQRPTSQPSSGLQARPHTISVVRANNDAGGDHPPHRSSSPLLQNLLSRSQNQPDGAVGSTPQFPPGLLAANPGLSGVKPGSLVVVASPSKTDPSSQLLHVYMVSPKNRVASPSKALDEVINTNSGLVRSRPNMSPRPVSRSPSPLARAPPTRMPQSANPASPSRKRTLSESSASPITPTRKRTLSGTFEAVPPTTAIIESEASGSNLPVAKKSKPPEGSSSDGNT